MEKFNKAVEFVRKPPSGNPIQSSNDDKLKMYSFFKQATVGPCAQHGGEQPWAVNMEARAKWDAWNNLGGMSSEEAQQEYIKVLDSIVPNWEC